MASKLLFILFLFSLSLYYVEAQASTVDVGPLLSCTLTTFSCPGVSGCCTIAGCCGSGCCANGYTCINEGTSQQTCCPASDPTKCGTVTPSSGTGTGSNSGDRTCTRIQNCPRDPVRGLAWTCLLGKTCGFTYNHCNPCPYILEIGSGTGSDSSGSDSSGSDSSGSDSSGSDSSDSDSSGSDSSGSDSSSSSSSSDSTSSSSSSATTPGVLPSSSSSSGSSPSNSGSSPGTSPSPSSSSSTSLGYRSKEGMPILHWLAAVVLGGVLVIHV